MTKFFKKVFICGILLSSVGAYCQEVGTLVDIYPQFSDGKLSLNEGSVQVDTETISNTNLTVGSLAEGLEKGVDTNKQEILKATDLIVANKQVNGLFNPVFANNGAPQVVLVGSTSNYHFGSDDLADYVYDNTVNNGSETADNYSFQKVNNEWKINDDGSTVVQVINLDDADSPFNLSGDKLLFTGTLATKIDGIWTLTDDSPLNKAELKVNSEKKLTMGNTQKEQSDGSGGTVTFNTGPTTLTVTEFGKVSGPIELMNEGYDPADTTKQTQWEAKVVLEPGSEAAEGTTITNGTTDLSKYFTTTTDTETEKTLLEGNSTAGALLNAEINGKVDIFSQIIPLDTTGDAKSEMIGLVNNSNISQVFPNITSQSGGQITLEVPYTYNIDGGSAYNSLEDISDNVQANNKVVINLVSKDKLAGLFKNGTEIDYKMNGKNTENISELIDNTIAYAHNIDGTSTTDVYLDVSSLKKFDNTFKSDEYLYSGLEGAKKLNVIPLDGDAFVIPCNDKSEATSPGDTVSAFNLIASTDKNSDVIKKYIEPNMNDTKVKTATGEALDPQPATITYSTKLSKVGASDSKKTLLLNSLNNTRNRKVLLDESYLNVKSKDNNDINIGTLEVNNSSEITLSGTNTVQNLVMDPTSKLRIRGKFIWGSAAV